MKFSLAVLFLICVSTLGLAETGKESFVRLCSSCHGMEGLGDGPVGKALPPGTMPNMQTGTRKFAISEAKFKELIQKGGGAVGLSPLMPAQAGLSDEQISEIFKYVNSFKK